MDALTCRLGIRCNSVLPGMVDTPMTQGGAPPGVREQLCKSMTSLGRMAQPEGEFSDREEEVSLN